jgi:hypothetical protein
MRRGWGWGAAILGILLLVGVGIAAYNWGLREGLEQSGNVEVVRYVGGHGYGFFPFFPFFLLIPLFFLLFFAFKGFGWRRHWNHDHGEGGPGPGPHGRWEQGYEDWHRRQHEAGGGSSGTSGAGGEPV